MAVCECEVNSVTSLWVCLHGERLGGAVGSAGWRCVYHISAIREPGACSVHGSYTQAYTTVQRRTLPWCLGSGKPCGWDAGPAMCCLQLCATPVSVVSGGFSSLDWWQHGDGCW